MRTLILVAASVVVSWIPAEGGELKVSRPAPRGPWPVGTSIKMWTDETRPELATEDQDDKRQLIVQLWYPADSSGESHQTTKSSDAIQPFRALSSYRNIFPSDDLGQLESTASAAALDAAWNPQLSSVPTVVFVHGWQSQSSSYISLLENLASHGLLAVGVDQPFQGRIALPDGSVTSSTEDHFDDPMKMIASYGNDLRFVLDQLAELNQQPGHHRGRIDLKRVALAGHSNGALSALAAADDPRVTAIVSLDKWEPIFEQVFGPEKPFLLLRTGGADAPSADYLARLPKLELVELDETDHLSATDWPFLRTSGPERQRATENLERIGSVLVEFFDRHLELTAADTLSTSP